MLKIVEVANYSINIYIFHSFELVNSELDEVETYNYALFFIQIIYFFNIILNEFKFLYNNVFEK